MKPIRNACEGEGPTRAQYIQNKNKNNQDKALQCKRKTKSGNYDSNFGKAIAKSKLSKYLLSSNAEADVNTNSKQTEVDSEEPVLENLKLKTIKSSNDAQKKVVSKHNAKSKTQYWKELKQVILKNDKEGASAEDKQILVVCKYIPKETHRNLKNEHIEKCIKKKVPSTQVTSREDFFRDNTKTNQKERKIVKNSVYGSCVVPDQSQFANKTKLELVLPGSYRALHSSKEARQSRLNNRRSTNNKSLVCSGEESKKVKERKFLLQHLKQKAMKTKDNIKEEDIRENTIDDANCKDNTLHEIVRDLKKCDKLTDSLSFESAEFKNQDEGKENFNIFKTHQCRSKELISSFSNDLYEEINCNSEIVASDIDGGETSTKEDKESTQKISYSKMKAKNAPNHECTQKI